MGDDLVVSMVKRNYLSCETVCICGICRSAPYDMSPWAGEGVWISRDVYRQQLSLPRGHVAKIVCLSGISGWQGGSFQQNPTRAPGEVASYVYGWRLSGTGFLGSKFPCVLLSP